MLQATVEFDDTTPAGHSVQVVAPVAASVFVTLPGTHSEHSVATLEAAENRPAEQIEHTVAPGFGPVSVTWPGAQSVHSDAPEPLKEPAAQRSQVGAWLLAAENFPAAHGVQTVAPGIDPVSVTEPTAQAAQFAATLVAVTFANVPAAQGVQSAAPGFNPVSVTWPGAQTVHAAAPPVLYAPAGHNVQLATLDDPEK